MTEDHGACSVRLMWISPVCHHDIKDIKDVFDVMYSVALMSFSL